MTSKKRTNVDGDGERKKPNLDGEQIKDKTAEETDDEWSDDSQDGLDEVVVDAEEQDSGMPWRRQF